jgi:N-acyl-D-aspartate/D-glutamate deacylase
MTFGVGAGRRLEEMLKLVDTTATAGGRMFGQTHSRGVSVVLSFLSRTPFDRLPVWSEVRALAPEEQLAALRDESLRQKLVDIAEHGDYGRAIGAEAPRPDYASMLVYDRAVPPNPSVSEAAAARGVDPVELILDLAVDSDLRQLFIQPLTPTADDALLKAMKHPRTVMTFSDAGAHVSQISDVSIQTHLLAYWVRERQMLTLEEAIPMITRQPAMLWRLHDRGLLQEGYAADITVFDPETVAPEMPEVVTDLPGGSRRLIGKAQGYKATFVNGEMLMRDGEPTEARSGQLLRGGRLTVG